jgi:hypothetical protein
MVYLYQEKITPPGPLPARTKPPDVPTLQHTINSLKQENAWLKEQLARIVRDKLRPPQLAASFISWRSLR